MEPQVILEPIARDQTPVLLNLLELYIHDFSEHVPVEIKSNGRFEIPLGEQWWTSDDHFPFFLRWHGKLTGFALARRGSRITGARDVMDVAEFFVLRGARGKGVGTSAAHALFAAFPGKWEIRVRRSNVEALRFWLRAAEAQAPAHHPITPSPFVVNEVDWDVLQMDVPVAHSVE